MYCNVLCYTIQYCTTHCCSVLYGTVYNLIILYDSVQYCNAPHCTCTYTIISRILLQSTILYLKGALKNKCIFCDILQKGRGKIFLKISEIVIRVLEDSEIKI